ncbi:SLC13 family permease [Microbacterium sp. CIAB417]|uniref:SLC13 family permease n=1 Tax=Microbacterium sp. CIAB417 TaxID=2860287 RepID=UPI001FAD41A8|nr:SLC13 family permease [Microbacterium sp. CIAB417]
MKLALIGGALLLVGIAAVLFGILPVDAAVAVAERILPVLGFVTAITVVAELATRVGLFDVLGAFLARLSRGRTILLWLLVVALALVSTAFLSLDTTAVLLTPVVVAVARANGLPPLPFAFATVWLANTASLFLPVSNLTNLLAAHNLEGGTGAFIGLLGPSALIAVFVTVTLLWLRDRRQLRGRFSPARSPHVADRALLIAAGVIVAVMLPLLVSGLEPWIPATFAAVLLVGFVAWRSPRLLSLRLIPWQLLVFASGLLLVASAADAAGLLDPVSAVLNASDQPWTVFAVAGAGTVGANVINNLPAYLALEPAVATSPIHLAALLIGVNAGPLVTPWASLATLLWHERLRSEGIEVSWGRFILWGALAAPLVVGLATLPLLWMR